MKGEETRSFVKDETFRAKKKSSRRHLLTVRWHESSLESARVQERLAFKLFGPLMDVYLIKS